MFLVADALATIFNLKLANRIKSQILVPDDPIHIFQCFIWTVIIIIR